MFVSKELRPRFNFISLKCVNFSGGHPETCRLGIPARMEEHYCLPGQTLFSFLMLRLFCSLAVLGKAKLQVALPSRTKRSALHLLEKLCRYAEEK